MIYFLLARDRHWAMFGLGALATVAASYSIVQGFVVWPVGLICVLWDRPWAARAYVETIVWISAATITAAVYWHSFDAANSQCGSQSCTANYGLRHPQLLAVRRVAHRERHPHDVLRSSPQSRSARASRRGGRHRRRLRRRSVDSGATNFSQSSAGAVDRIWVVLRRADCSRKILGRTRRGAQQQPVHDAQPCSPHRRRGVFLRPLSLRRKPARVE